MSGVLGIATQLRLVGVVLVALGPVHLVLPRLLGWPAEFTALQPLTRQVMRAHTLFIGLVCVLLGLLPLALPGELLGTGRLGAVVLAGECVFWGLRWAAQFLVFPPRVWRGSRLHVLGYLGFTVLWTWVGAVFAVALARSAALH